LDRKFGQIQNNFMGSKLSNKIEFYTLSVVGFIDSTFGYLKDYALSKFV